MSIINTSFRKSIKYHHTLLPMTFLNYLCPNKRACNATPNVASTNATFINLQELGHSFFLLLLNK